MARLSTLDSSFLRVETPNAHMHVGWLAPLELPPGVDRLDAVELIERIGARLHLAPRFRQRLASAPLGIAEPTWVDDPQFALRRHIRVIEPPDPLSRSDLRTVTDRFLSTQLRRDRPLWEILIVPRVAGRGAAVLGKVHHAMVDGIAAVELGMVLFDLSPDAEVPLPADWEPEGTAGPLRLAVDAVADSALDQFRAAQAHRLRRPRAGARAPDRGHDAARGVLARGGRDTSRAAQLPERPDRSAPDPRDAHVPAREAGERQGGDGREAERRRARDLRRRAAASGHGARRGSVRPARDGARERPRGGRGGRQPDHLRIRRAPGRRADARRPA